MAFRIYALAKELKIDSKELVEICPRAGVTGKGSALASLTEDEVVKIKAFLSGGGVKPAAKPTAGPATKPAAPATTPGGLAPTFRREDYIAPGGTQGKPAMLGNRPTEARPAGGETRRKPPAPDAPRQQPPKTPAIRLAALPTAAPPPEATSSEPPAQKPDIKLPADVLRAGKAGSKPLSEHIRKHEMKRRAEAGEAGSAPRTGGGPKQPAAPPLSMPGARDRSRRGGGQRTGVAAVGETGELGSALAGREARQINRKRRSGPGRRRDDDDNPLSSAPTRLRRSAGSNTAAPRKSTVVLELPCTVRSFSETLGLPVRNVLAKLLGLGNMANINSPISPELVELLAIELGVEVSVKQATNFEQELLAASTEEEDATLLEPRPPVVTFLGHVDHGKTSLLDHIIGIDVAAGESGGITQHIRAYRIEKDGRPITFVDTPGHEAFTAMRARGAHVTDIAVLVVAADDGVMPQTEEAISHARAAGVPIVVALNKVDLPGLNIDRVFQQLGTNELLPTAWGGDTEVVQTSAIKETGLDELLETLLTIAELQDFRANPHRAAYGTCLEAELHEGRGVVAKLLVQRGTLKVGDVLVCGNAYGRVKAMYDTLRPGVRHEEAGPSTPVNVTGLDVAPAAGEHFYVLDDIAKAREIAEKRDVVSRYAELAGTPAEHVTLENLFERLGQAEVQTLNLILRADVRGSIEAIKKELGKLVHPEVQIRILQATVGGVSEADVHLAHASDAVIIGFNVVPDEAARVLADKLGVQIRRYDIIYQVTEDLKKALEGMLKPEEREVELGRVLVQKLFTISRVGTIAGCRVLSGTIERSSRARLIRENRVIGDYAFDSLRREKDDVREVREGMECGIKLAGFNDLKEGDLLECYKVEEVARTL
ncbi:MAG: translation initiation factor IF-2 [Pirellulales bacterium]|nr:translation initiation factor IF-2 [Pirellulales bacterium]